MIVCIHTFGELAHWHPHIHALVSDGAFARDGTFVRVPEIAVEPFLKLWEKDSIEPNTVLATEWCESYTVGSDACGSNVDPCYGMHHDAPLDCRASARVHADGSAKWLKRTDDAYEAQWSRGPGQVYWYW